ncbi:putative sucrose transporter [Phaeomoniella chlamydospora]|uniref:Putative sucrose transporter n=1 Tax=Phaeomoniella chlamydospora TaxID=158046 RepID=A0A0G2GPK7_PHACM|nr:putative sucrose transporter [Phaeomoniella chlamydospora]
MCTMSHSSTVQAAIRAFIVDNAPTHQQEEANAWASRLNGIGNVLGYTFGYADLPKIFPFLGKTQFEVLCAIATFALAITLFISCSIIKEEDPSLWGPPDRSGAGLFTFFRQTFRSVRRLQPQVRKICEVQLANWIAWFPFLFYMTTFIGQLYVNPYLEKNEKDHNLSDRDIDQLWQEGTRVGTFALLIYSITSFASNVFLPFLVIPTYIPRGMQKVHSVQSMVVATSPIGSRPRTPMAIPRTPGNDPSVYFPETDPAPAKPPSRLARLLNHLRIPGLTLRRLWMFAQILFAVCMFSTFFIRTPMLGAIMTAFVGVSWSVSLWAPFALISAEIAKSADKVREHYLKKAAKRQKSASSDSSASASPVPKPSNPQPVEDDNEIDERDEVTAQAGIILGLHNCSISAPQIVATLISSAVFRALQKPRGTPGDDSVGWVLRLAGVAALVAAYMTSRLDDRKDDDGSEE